MAKELKSCIYVDESGIPSVDKFVSDVTKWAKSAQPCKWIVRVYQDLTREQRAYFNGVIVSHVASEYTKKTGEVKSRGEIKDQLKKEFSPLHTKTGWNEDTGEEAIFTYIPSTEDLSKEEYSELIDNCLNYCIDILGVPCPESRIN